MPVLFKRVKVDSLNLEPGMFVAQLDRPWLETPFFFQAFEISTTDEVGLLRKFCKHVYIDVDRSSLPKDKIMAARNSMSRDHDPFQRAHTKGSRPSQPGWQFRLLSALSLLDPTGWLANRLSGQNHYVNQVPMQEETPRAAHAYGIAVNAMDRLLDRARRGKRIDANGLKMAVDPLIESILRNQDAMAWLVYQRKRDEYSFNHSVASAVWAVILGRHLGFDRNGLQALAIGGMLMDVGKVRIPPWVADKDGPLSTEEQDIMQMHVDYSARIAGKIPGLGDQVMAMVSCHHERHDGSGYPRQLRGTDIPVFGRIAGLVDCYDAMISKRKHADAKSAYDAVRELNLLAGSQFQRELVEQFVQALGMFPTGTIVELNTGEVGVVIEQNSVRRLRPKVLMVVDAKGGKVTDRKLLDLKRLPSDEGHRRARWIVTGHEPGAYGIEPRKLFA